jgi:hypothetical protein
MREHLFNLIAEISYLNHQSLKTDNGSGAQRKTALRSQYNQRDSSARLSRNLPSDERTPLIRTPSGKSNLKGKINMDTTSRRPMTRETSTRRISREDIKLPREASSLIKRENNVHQVAGRGKQPLGKQPSLRGAINILTPSIDLNESTALKGIGNTRASNRVISSENASSSRPKTAAKGSESTSFLPSVQLAKKAMAAW